MNRAFSRMEGKQRGLTGLTLFSQVRGGIEPPSMDLQSSTLPLCYLTTAGSVAVTQLHKGTISKRLWFGELWQRRSPSLRNPAARSFATG